MLGTASRLQTNPNPDKVVFKAKYDDLLQDAEFKTFVDSRTQVSLF
ncbi:MAG: hypothetical protein IPH74_05165 [Bacteroidetes bacterium]|nr:hypothetical protein [Bacteroidota bacterium]